MAEESPAVQRWVADKVFGNVISFEPSYPVEFVREPHGVVANIIPCYYTVPILGRSVAPALATGNTCLVEAAEDGWKKEILALDEMRTTETIGYYHG
jgi:acyl-CoA reductase-like NAD-dependent aldehyde dehydrogenase